MSVIIPLFKASQSMWNWSKIWALNCLLFSLLVGGIELQAEDEIDFARDIQPILSDTCFNCHGPDSATREGGFRLDNRDSAIGQGDSGQHPIVVGDPAASEIIIRMLSSDESDVMPPPEQVKRPTAEQVELIKRWIKKGAEWKQHWAFTAPQKAKLPSPENPSWPRNGIDHFVIAKLDAMGVQPNEEASQTTLVRRLYLDLVGLPPTPAEVDLFLNDQSDKAYENLVDRLLASPAYGEHLATFWLDAARFADTNGYQNDFQRNMWPWRDWVIHAFNNNMPYDQFTVEQLAGDMLPNATISQKVASGFNRNHRSNTEGGSIDEEWRVENVVDRVEATSTVFLGLTMGCARCHDHKFDPISQREFYQFYAYFNNSVERGVYTETRGNAGPIVRIASPELDEELQQLESMLASQNRELEQRRIELNQAGAVSEKQFADKSATEIRGEAIAILRSPIIGGTPLKVIQDALTDTGRVQNSLVGSALKLEAKPDQHLNLADAFAFDASKDFAVSAMVKADRFGAILSRMKDDGSYRGFDMLISPDGRLSVHLIHQWPGNATKVTSRLPLEKGHWANVSVVCAAPGKAKDVKIFFNGHLVEHTVDNDSLAGTTLTDHPLWVGLRTQTPPFVGLISDVRIWSEALSAAEVETIYNQNLERMFLGAQASGSQEDLAEVSYQTESVFRRQIQKTEADIKSLKKRFPTTMVMQERTTPRQAYVLNRGIYDQADRSQPVSPGIPALFKSEEQPANRLELAQWMVNGDNPLTARVAVNHFWNRYFGRGLLSTPENFGVQSPLPSHPELLDWLACEFVESGWDIKALQRLIVTSSTYRQSSVASAEDFANDANNSLLSRGSRYRLPAETIRDNALAVSGLLTSRVGGPSVKPYQPEGLWADLAGGAGEPPYQQSTGADLYRRSLYTYRKRTVPHPTVMTFDGVGRDVCAVARDRTNTPLQALALLNDVTYVEASIHLAVHAMQSEKQREERLKVAFRKATCRWPDTSELEILSASFAKYQAYFANDIEAAQAFLDTGESKPPSDLNPGELAAFASVCSVILNFDEVITRE